MPSDFRMDQMVLMQEEEEYLEQLRAGARTCVHRHAVDEAEESLLLDMLGLVA